MAPKEGITDHPVLESPATRIIGLYPPILSRAVHLMSNSCRTTNRTVLVAPETEIIRFWTLQQHGSSGSAPAPLLAASLLNPCKTTGRTDLAAPESWITQFWNLQQHSAPTPLLATPLLIPYRTNGPYCSVRSRIMKILRQLTPQQLTQRSWPRASPFVALPCAMEPFAQTI